MPFTPTHVAAIVPVAFLSRNRLPFSALAIGSMIPDIQQFLPSYLQFDYRITNSLPGLFAACVPLGMLMFLWFQCVGKSPLVELLPHGMRSRMVPHDRPHLETRFRFFALVSLSILIGAISHLVWDAFTHEGHWGYRLLPFRDYVLWRSGDYVLPLFKALQHGSTVVFMPLMAYWAFSWFRHRTPAELQPILSIKQRWSWLLILLLLPNAIALIYCWRYRAEFVSLGHFAREAVTTAGLVFFLAINGYAFWFRRQTAQSLHSAGTA